MVFCLTYGDVQMVSKDLGNWGFSRLYAKASRAQTMTSFESKMSLSVTWNSATDLHVAQAYFNFSLFISTKKWNETGPRLGLVSKALASGIEFKGA